MTTAANLNSSVNQSVNIPTPQPTTSWGQKFRVPLFNLSSISLIGNVALTIITAGNPYALLSLFVAVVGRALALKKVSQAGDLETNYHLTKIGSFILWIKNKESTAPVEATKKEPTENQLPLSVLSSPPRRAAPSASPQTPQQNVGRDLLADLDAAEGADPVHSSASSMPSPILPGSSPHSLDLSPAHQPHTPPSSVSKDLFPVEEGTREEISREEEFLRQIDTLAPPPPPPSPPSPPSEAIMGSATSTGSSSSSQLQSGSSDEEGVIVSKHSSPRSAPMISDGSSAFKSDGSYDIPMQPLEISNQLERQALEALLVDVDLQRAQSTSGSSAASSTSAKVTSNPPSSGRKGGGKKRGGKA